MKRNCNLDLRLVTPSVCRDSADYNVDGEHKILRLDADAVNGGCPKVEKTLTIFYKGRVSAYDVTEHQARSIIMLASRENESNELPPQPAEPSPSPVALKTSSRFSSIPPTGHSMKRSLQRFLQKRNTRALALFPCKPTTKFR